MTALDKMDEPLANDTTVRQWRTRLHARVVAKKN